MFENTSETFTAIGAPANRSHLMFKRLLLSGIVILILFAIFVAFQPTRFRIERSVAISGTALSVFAHVNDFRKWESWLHWTRLDPDARIRVEGAPSGEGAVLLWSGNEAIGAGRMEIVESRLGSSIRIATTFSRPSAGKSTTVFVFKPQDGETLVTWSVEGENNFLAKAVCVFVGIDTVLGPDLEQGLERLRVAAETRSK